MITFAYIFIIISCILGEAFFSCTEMSTISSNKLKIRYLANKQHRGALKISKLMKKPQIFLSTTLVGVNLCIITATAFATNLMSNWIPEGFVNIATTIIMLPLILFFVEQVDKVIQKIPLAGKAR